MQGGYFWGSGRKPNKLSGPDLQALGGAGAQTSACNFSRECLASGAKGWETRRWSLVATDKTVSRHVSTSSPWRSASSQWAPISLLRMVTQPPSAEPRTETSTTAAALLLANRGLPSHYMPAGLVSDTPVSTFSWTVPFRNYPVLLQAQMDAGPTTETPLRAGKVTASCLLSPDRLFSFPYVGDSRRLRVGSAFSASRSASIPQSLVTFAKRRRPVTSASKTFFTHTFVPLLRRQHAVFIRSCSACRLSFIRFCCQRHGVRDWCVPIACLPDEQSCCCVGVLEGAASYHYHYYDDYDTRSRLHDCH